MPRGGGVIVFWGWETGEIGQRADVEASNVSVVSPLKYPVLTDPADFPAWYWHPYRYYLRGFVLCPSV